MKITNFLKNEVINKRTTGIKKNENKYIKDKKYSKVRDHCHYTREYRSAAHNIYNLKYSVPKTLAIVFHNASN